MFNFKTNQMTHFAKTKSNFKINLTSITKKFCIQPI